MSLPTWTASALASEARPFAGAAWRLVEAQHVASSSKLLDDANEQALLEEMLEASKPPLPGGRALHYLLSTPWRYRPGPGGSRFRGRHDPGVWYGAENVACAAAEIGYWRCRFLRDSEGLERLDPLPWTAFRARIATAAIDLAAPAFNDAREAWLDPDDYTASQALARAAREAGLGAIRWPSVRHPAPRPWCLAVLRLDAFARPRPEPGTQTWFLTVRRDQALWQRAHGTERLAFRWPA